MSCSGTGLKITGRSRFESSIVRSTSHTQRSDLTASGDTTNTTVSDWAIRPPRRASQSSPAARRRKADKFEPGDQFVGKFGRIFARIGDEDLEFFARTRI